MKTAYDLMNRIILLEEYIVALKSGRAAISNWNDDLGEGNPQVAVLSQLIKELEDEHEQHIETLKKMKSNEN